jgi:hypothetical protein
MYLEPTPNENFENHVTAVKNFIKLFIYGNFRTEKMERYTSDPKRFFVKFRTEGSQFTEKLAKVVQTRLENMTDKKTQQYLKEMGRSTNKFSSTLGDYSVLFEAAMYAYWLFVLFPELDPAKLESDDPNPSVWNYALRGLYEESLEKCKNVLTDMDDYEIHSTIGRLLNNIEKWTSPVQLDADHPNPFGNFSKNVFAEKKHRMVDTFLEDNEVETDVLLRQIRSSDAHEGALTETMLRDGTTDEPFPWLTFRYGGRFSDRFVPTKKAMIDLEIGSGKGIGSVHIINKSDGTVMEMAPQAVKGLYNSAPSAAMQHAILDISSGTQIELKQWLIEQGMLARDGDREFTVNFKGKVQPMTASEIRSNVLGGSFLMLKSETGGWETNRDKILAIVKGGEEEIIEDIFDEATFDSMDKATKTRKDRTASEIATLMKSTVVMVKQNGRWVNADTIAEIVDSGEDDQPDWGDEATFDSMDKATQTRKDRTASEIATLMKSTVVMVKQNGRWVNADTIAEVIAAVDNPFADVDDNPFADIDDNPFANQSQVQSQVVKTMLPQQAPRSYELHKFADMVRNNPQMPYSVFDETSQQWMSPEFHPLLKGILII